LLRQLKSGDVRADEPPNEVALESLRQSTPFGRPDDGCLAPSTAGTQAPFPSDLAAAPIKARQVCFRPVTEDGLPLIGAVPGSKGAYVATGHSVWGMLNAPATGEAMTELILDGTARHVDLAPFEPGRMRTFDPARLRRL
jgi:hypothetical protein